MIKCTIIGNLGRDAEIRTINQKEYYRMSVGTRRRKDESPLWVQVMYPRRSDGLDGLLREGAKIYARGDMQVGAFTRRDGSVEPDVTLWGQELQLLSSSEGGDGKAVLVHPKSVIKNEWRPPSCVDWDACEEEHEREIAEEALLRELAESEAEERAMDGYYRDKYG